MSEPVNLVEPHQNGDWLVDPTLAGRSPDSVCIIGHEIIYRWFESGQVVCLRVSVASVACRHPHRRQFLTRAVGKPTISSAASSLPPPVSASRQQGQDLAGKIERVNHLKSKIARIVQDLSQNDV
jgi:hypothetical protein